MSSEWGVFNDEGLLFETNGRERAEEAAKKEVADGDPHAYAGPICGDHECQCAWYCEECNEEENESESEESDNK